MNKRMVLIMAVAAVCWAYAPIGARADQIVYVSPAGTKNVLIIVNAAVYPAIKTSLTPYIKALEGEQYRVEVLSFDYLDQKRTSPVMLKERYLQPRYAGLTGVILVGSLPVPYFQPSTFNAQTQSWDLGTNWWPCDLYYMKKDGIWTPKPGQEYDAFVVRPTSTSVDCWVSRITAGPLAVASADEATLIRKYLSKNIAFRTGAIKTNPQALYWDDGLPAKGDQMSGVLYPKTNVLDKLPPEVSANLYRQMVKTGPYEFVHATIHSWPTGHGFFKDPGSNVMATSEVKTLDPKVRFYALQACNNVRYIERDYMGGNYVFSTTNGLAAIGATNYDYIKDYSVFFTKLASGSTFGSAYSALIAYDDIPYYTLLGDGTLTLRPAGKLFFPPAALSGAWATPESPKTIRVQWIDTITNKKDGCRVERSLNGTSFAQIAQVPPTTGYFVDINLTPGKTYYYRVRAYNAVGNSPYTAIFTGTTLLPVDTTPPAPPRVTTGSTYVFSTTQLSASFQATDVESGIAGYDYRILQDSIAGTPITAWKFAEMSTSGALTILQGGLSLEVGKKYYFEVRARNKAGLVSASGYSLGVLVRSPVPPAPVITCRSINSSTLQLSWNNASTLETGFVIFRQEYGTVSWTVAARVGANVTTFSDTTLKPATGYLYKVRAFCDAGYSEISNIVQSRTRPK